MRCCLWVALGLGVAGLAFGCGDDDSTPEDASTSDGASSDSSVEESVQLLFDLSDDAEFWARPFPLEGIRDDSGRPAIDSFPNPRRVDTIDALKQMIRDSMTGFSVSGASWFPFSGPIDVDMLPQDPASYRDDASSPIVLVDVDPDSPEYGSRRPLLVSGSEDNDLYRPADVLQVLVAPGFELREETTYAIVVRGLTSEGEPVAQHPDLRRLLQGEAVEGALGERSREDFAPLRDWLSAEELDAAEIVAATVFTTTSATSRLYDLAEWAQSQPAPSPSSAPQKILDMPEYCAYQGAWMAPQFQGGTPPFETEGGAMIFDDEGHPERQRAERAPFVVAVPKMAMPEAGFPLLFYVNGTGGVSRQVIDRGRFSPSGPAPRGTGPAQIAAVRGWGASGVAGIHTPERLSSGGLDGYIVYNLFNPVAMRDNFFQTIIEHILFRRLVLDLRIDPSTCDGVDASAASDSMVRYDPDRLAVMGQSLGSYLAGMLTTLDPGFLGAILSGAGGSWIEFAFGAREPDLTALARFALSISGRQPFDRWHPGLALFNWAVGPADNIHYLHHVLRDPRRGDTRDYEPPHMLIIEGDDDTQIGPGLQRALVAALGVDLVGEDVGASDDRILPWIELRGRSTVNAPISDNLETPSGARTAAVVRYLPDFDDLGHHVAFQLDEPKHQYGCFLETLLTEDSPVIVQGTTVHGPCE